MTEVEQLVIDAYREMSNLTEPHCAACAAKKGVGKYRCCHEMACRAAGKFAEQSWGVVLKQTGHKRLPLMGPNGCTAPPHLRPICTMADCEMTENRCAHDPVFQQGWLDLLVTITNLETSRAEEKRISLI